MIVADANLLAYLALEGPQTESARAVFRRDPEWIAPLLWRSEFRSVLAGNVRLQGLAMENAQEAYERAVRVLRDERLPLTSHVLSLVATSSLTAYDCEYVALAQSLHVPLVTADQHVLRAFPTIAVSPEAFAR